MPKLRIVSAVAALTACLLLASPTPFTAVANAVDPCSATITKGGSPASATDVVVSLVADTVYCTAQFKTVASDYAFSVPSGISKIDYLIVAGGGGGASGGGGGGGVLMATDFAVAPGSSLPITVGGGGAGGWGAANRPSNPGDKGGNSSINSIVALGGGGGGSGGGGSTDVNGGSGGGSQFDCTSPNCGGGIAGAGTPGQGNNGGYSTYNSYGAGGGGGGAGGAGFNTTRNYIGGNGGNGISSSITGTNNFYGGGGGGGINNNHGLFVGVDANNQLVFSAEEQTTGGGVGGLGGGGRGSSFGHQHSSPDNKSNATSGQANTGGGGGGTDPEDINAGAGGSGIVVVRWISNVNLQKITFNSNSENVQSTTQWVGKGVSEKLAPNNFSRVGYIFAGWNTAADGSGQTNYANEGVVSTQADLTLYAKWTTGVTRQVVFDANGATGAMANLVAGKPTSLTLNSFTKASSEFAGWNTKADGTGFSYVDGDTYQFQTDITLYAQWRPVVTKYTATFYGNGATGGSTASQYSATSSPLNLNGFVRAGYNFLGWNTTYNSPTATYRDQQNYAFTQDVSLYAIWVIQASNDITFNGNGTVLAPTTGATEAQTASSSTVLRANGFAREGFTFLHWNTQADGGGVSYQSSYAYSFAAGLTLFAIWGENIDVLYSSNGATGGSVPTAQSTYVGSAGISVATAGSLERTGFRLVGWNTRNDSSGTPIALGASRVKFASDATLFAVWEAATYAVVYSGNGNSAGVEPEAQLFTYSTPIALKDNTGNLAKENHNFDGWNTEPDGTGITYVPAAASVTLSDDTVLFAKWISIASVGGPRTGNDSNFIEAPVVATPPVATVPPKAKSVSLTIYGFAAGKSTLTPSMQRAIRQFIARNPGYKTFSVVGVTSGPTVLKTDANLSRARATSASVFVRKKLNANLRVKRLTGLHEMSISPTSRKITVTLFE